VANELEALHKTAMEDFEASESMDREQRAAAVKDMRFVNEEGGQWDDDLVEKRRNRPRYTVDRISPAIDQGVGAQRQVRTSLKAVPLADGNEKTADIYTGLMRNIEQDSHSQNAYDAAYDEALTCGYGGWRILTEFESDDAFEQVIRIKPILSAVTSLYCDPSAREYDKSDGRFKFLISRMSTKAFKERYPNAAVTDFTGEEYVREGRCDWFSGGSVRLAEYWYKKPAQRTLGLLSDGRTIDVDEEADVLDELAQQGITVVRTRTVDSHDVEMVVMNGAEILGPPKPWAGKFIPIIPVYGRLAWLEDKQYVRGIVRKARDPQQIYNYATSAAVEATAATPKDPVWLTPKQAQGHEKQLRQAPTSNSPYMLYNPDTNASGPPQRGGAPQLQTSLLQQIEQSKTDIHATTGVEPASLGNIPVVKSGVAINAETRQGDRGLFVFSDNLEKSKQFTGRILVDLIPRIYDTKRVVKVLGPDEVFTDVTINDAEVNGINQPVMDAQTGKQVIVNDLSQGNYSVLAKTGPLFATQREETVAQLVTLTAESPVIQELALDIVIDNMDLNQGDELKRRVRKRMITQGIVEPTEEEKEELGLNQPTPPDPMQEASIKNIEANTEQQLVNTEKLISETRNEDADTQSKLFATQKTAADAYSKIVDALAAKVQAGGVVTEEDLEMLRGQQALVEEAQVNVLERNELAETPPIGARLDSPPI